MTNANNTRRSFLSKVMKAAWTIFRKGGKTFSQSLKKAWKWAKKNIATQQPAAAMTVPVDVQRETAKAYLLAGCAETHAGYMDVTFWMPKSAIESVTAAGVVIKDWAVRMFDEKCADIAGFIAFAE